MTEKSTIQLGLVERSVENLVSTLVALVPGLTARRFHAGAADLLVGFVLLLALLVGGERIVTAQEPFTFGAVANLAGLPALTVAAATFALLAFRGGGEAVVVATALVWAMCLGAVLSSLCYLLIPVGTAREWILYVELPRYLPVVLVIMSQLPPLPGTVVAIAALLPGAILSFELMSLLFSQAQTAASTPPDTEMIYSQQGELLAAETDIPRGDPSRVELFAVLGAGFPYQGVFAREVAAVGALLEAEFGAEGRVVRLINDDEDQNSYPLLNRTNLRRALTSVGQRMNHDDILFLFLSSHGSPGRLSTKFDGVIGRDITPDDIDAAIDGSGIGRVVVVVSACYSGSFIKALSQPERLILTASRADRTSFGCSDTAEWTEWGRAFFVEGLRRTRDPREAARLAQRFVKVREAEMELVPSEPQIIEGDRIGAALEAWLATLPATSAPEAGTQE